MTKLEWQNMTRENNWRWWPLLTLDDLAIIGATVVVFCVLEFLRGLLA